jgi:cell division protein FtsL
MATLATFFDRFVAARSTEESVPRARFLEQEDPFQVPAFPNEDVYFYVKHIVNSGVVRVADPAARKVCWRMIGYSSVLAILIISLLLPTLYELMAGYKMEALRQERQRLELNRAALELEETKLVSPARLEELARMQQFVDPSPESVVYLESKSDSILAKK